MTPLSELQAEDGLSLLEQTQLRIAELCAQEPMTVSDYAQLRDRPNCDQRADAFEYDPQDSMEFD